ncbi:MAG: 2,3-diphosphoglycerate-dependent phosphoglycerate mutase [Bacilli bacterium]|nr:2,3-diphosphoglycerate-dependent phosphoglycerate mutase [Bacilli bacterium]
MSKLVLVRHGESVWNKENKFTGWTNVELSEKGIEEAKEAGRKLKENGFTFDLAYTSLLKRANDTLNYILLELDLYNKIDVIKSYKLNERHYGALQGLNKDETRKKYGEEQVHIWRRSFSVRPPELEYTDPRFPGNDDTYKDVPLKDLPVSESLLDVYNRVVPYYLSDIVPNLKNNKNIIISAHGNSLRALYKYLNNISDEDIPNFEISTGEILVYEFDENFEIKEHYKL